MTLTAFCTFAVYYIDSGFKNLITCMKMYAQVHI